jgi:penicillin-binding protein 1A
MVGGREYRESQFNRAVQALRQPGSAFKPIVYLAAIENGMTPDSLIEDAPLKVGRWSPQNYDGGYRGTITAREALAESINTAAVRVLQFAGISRTQETARALGIESPLKYELAMALGTNELTPLELTTAYAAIAAGGRAITPYAILEIRSRAGDVLYQRTPARPPVTVDPGAVATLVDMMGDVVRTGTGRRAQLDRPVAGKTGTTSDYRDAWFVGFTADYTTGVWMGNDDNTPMKKVTGGSLPAQLWRNYMMAANAGLPVRAIDIDTSVSVARRNEDGTYTQEQSGAFSAFVRGLFGGNDVDEAVEEPVARRRGGLVIEHTYPEGPHR